MLVLTRKIGQVIEIDGGIQITIIDTKGRSVRVGVQAPPNIRIRRQELPPENTTQEPEYSDKP